jgi:hypothetical protein
MATRSHGNGAARADAQVSQLGERCQLRWDAASEAVVAQVAARQRQPLNAAYHDMEERRNTKGLRHLAQRYDGQPSGPTTYRETASTRAYGACGLGKKPDVHLCDLRRAREPPQGFRKLPLDVAANCIDLAAEKAAVGRAAPAPCADGDRVHGTWRTRPDGRGARVPCRGHAARVLHKRCKRAVCWGRCAQ